MFRFLHLCLLASLVSNVADAQNLAVSAGGNVFYSWNSANTVVGGGPGGFTADLGVGDQLGSSHWCYSIEGSGTGQVLDGAGNGAFTVASLLPHLARCTIGDVDGLGQMDTLWVATADSSGTRSGSVAHLLSLTNRSAGSLQVRVYFLADFDAAGSAGGDSVATCSSSSRLLAEEGDSRLELFADGASHWQIADVADPSGPEEAILSGAHLSDTGFAATGANLIFAVEWDLSLSAGAGAELRLVMGCNDLHAGQSALQGSLTQPVGSNGGPMLSSSSLFLGATSWDLSVTNAPLAAAAGVLLIDVGTLGGPPSVLGLPLLADVDFAMDLPLSGGIGGVSLPLSCNPGLAGLRAQAQVVVADPASPASVPFGVSQVLSVLLGD